jgi:hypothetical protein
MIQELFILILIPIVLGIIFARYLELVPQFIFWLIAQDKRKDEFKYITPEDIEVSAELVEYYYQETPIIAWFFPGKNESKATVLMVPNWFLKEDHENNLKAAGILQNAGYNVLLPIFHWNLDGKVFQKRYVSPKTCQRIIDESYKYLRTRPDIDRRNIALWSNASGTILACQIVKDHPIKSIILEDGPVTLWNDFSDYLNYTRNFPYSVTKFILILLLWPFLWRTKWQSKHILKKLGACPSFLIATREDSRKQFWRSFTFLHRPKQLWFEHGLPMGGIRDLWTQEYCLQVRVFYDTYFKLLQSPKPDFHYELSADGRKNGRYSFRVRITSMPPQMEKIPIQIIVSHKGNRFSEYRVWFSGVSFNLHHSCKDRPLGISVSPFYNVVPCTGDVAERRMWLKKEAHEALNIAIQEVIKYPLRHLRAISQRYFFIKSIILQEQENRNAASNALEEISSKHWNNMIKKDPDSRAIRADSKQKVVSEILLPTMTL